MAFTLTFALHFHDVFNTLENCTEYNAIKNTLINSKNKQINAMLAKILAILDSQFWTLTPFSSKHTKLIAKSLVSKTCLWHLSGVNSPSYHAMPCHPSPSYSIIEVVYSV